MDLICPLKAESSKQFIINDSEHKSNSKKKQQIHFLQSKDPHNTVDELTGMSDTSKKNEFLMRLEASVKKLQLQEQGNSAKWYLDISIPDIKENASSKKIKLPSHVEENMKGILHLAQDYKTKLEEQMKYLNIAGQQIENDMTKTLNEIDETCRTLMDIICKEISEKHNLLRLEAEVYKNESLIPLKACREEVKAQIISTQHLIAITEIILKHSYIFNRDRYEKIITAGRYLGSIPTVPYLGELPSISFNRPSDMHVQEILKCISELGSVLHKGPVQITDIKERPACLFVKWDLIDPEYIGKKHVFIVQKANGEVLDSTSNIFESVYEGSETYCFVRDLSINYPVTLRVRIQATERAWSVPRTAITTIPPYKWENNNNNYMITNNGAIAAKITSGISTLFSKGPQFDTYHIIEFKFLEASQEGKDDEGIALVLNPEGNNDNLKKVGALLITPCGSIFVDGQEKLTQLPRIRLGTRITCTAFPGDVGTLRINIESADKSVTYDWHVQTPLFFAARFTEHNKWNVIVK
ncbi:hypothetical protein KPH14_003306 [Odynerus spinipes]|uniref:Cytokine receptor-like factor 3 n=1 Tax=Odynerus spinipes TaxID=1348599 RepID=A0AAD9RDS1_9HYME|nr:hypothetical protein KPH14_003306 [Odynerus spinipes]